MVWHGHRKYTFREQLSTYSSERHSIASLGLPGDIVVFMARSRVERDMWVNALGHEINRRASTVGEELHVY